MKLVAATSAVFWWLDGLRMYKIEVGNSRIQRLTRRKVQEDERKDESVDEEPAIVIVYWY